MDFTIHDDPVNILDGVGFVATTLRPGSEVGTKADYARAAEIVHRVNHHDELVGTVRALVSEWKRQKGLFPVLSRDGWMDLKVGEAELLLAHLEGR